jgi:hypothetical protein
MSRCDLEIVIDREDRRYQAGERVSGLIGVTVNKDCTCDGLTVTREWRTHGSGNSATGGSEVQVVFSGEWKAGEQHFHPFEVTVPRGPVTYRGHLLNVDWYIRARADIPWAFDPKAEEEILLVPDDDPTPFELGPQFAGGLDLSAASAVGRVIVTVMAGGFISFALVFLVLGIGAVGVGLGAALFSKTSTGIFEGAFGCLFAIPFILVPLVFIALPGWLLYRAWRNVLAERRLGEVDLQAPEGDVRGGEAFPVGVSFTPKGRIALNAVHATLRGREVVVRGSGTNKHTYRHTLYEQKTALCEEQAVEPGTPVSLEGELVLPDDAAPSFRALDNQLRWSITFEIDVAGWADWNREWVLAVQPRP